MNYFITTVSMNNPKNMDSVKFVNGTGNPVVEHTTDITFKNGIMVPISNVVSEGEKIRIILMVNYKEPKDGKELRAVKFTDGSKEYDYFVSADVQGNYNEFTAELEVLKERLNFEYEIEYLFVPDDEKATTHFDIFTEIVHKLQNSNSENNMIYTDITFGMAPMPIIVFMALNYVCSFSKKFRTEAIIYAHRDHETKVKTIFELSHMFSLNSALEKMKNAGIENPIGMIEKFIRE